MLQVITYLYRRATCLRIKILQNFENIYIKIFAQTMQLQIHFHVIIYMASYGTLEILERQSYNCIIIALQ